MREMGEKTRINTYSVIKKVTCDLCGKESPDPEGSMDSQSWDRNTFNVEETSLYLKEGRTYPEAGTHEYLECDICPDCFKTKLVPWLEQQGVEMRSRKVEF